MLHVTNNNNRLYKFLWYFSLYLILGIVLLSGFIYRNKIKNKKKRIEWRNKKNLWKLFHWLLTHICWIISVFLHIVSCFWSVIGCLVIRKKNRPALRGTGFCARGFFGFFWAMGQVASVGWAGAEQLMHHAWSCCRDFPAAIYHQGLRAAE